MRLNFFLRVALQEISDLGRKIVLRPDLRPKQRRLGICCPNLKRLPGLLGLLSLGFVPVLVLLDFRLGRFQLLAGLLRCLLVLSGLRLPVILRRYLRFLRINLG